MREHEEFAFLNVNWGLFSDIDIESEKIRFAGAARYPIYAAHHLLGLIFKSIDYNLFIEVKRTRVEKNSRKIYYFLKKIF